MVLKKTSSGKPASAPTPAPVPDAEKSIEYKLLEGKIIAALKTSEGQMYRYPLTLRLIS